MDAIRTPCPGTFTLVIYGSIKYLYERVKYKRGRQTPRQQAFARITTTTGLILVAEYLEKIDFKGIKLLAAPGFLLVQALQRIPAVGTGLPCEWSLR